MSSTQHYDRKATRGFNSRVAEVSENEESEWFVLNQVSKNWDIIFLLFNPWLRSLLIKDVFHIELGHFLRFLPLVAEKFIFICVPFVLWSVGSNKL